MSEARSEVLARIRRELGTQETTIAERTVDRDQGYARIAREYVQAGSLSEQARLDLLLERLVDYEAEVVNAEEGSLATAVAAVLARHGESVLLVAPEVPAAWLPAGVEVLRDGAGPGDLLSDGALARAEAVLTRCAGAIAETGTLLLAHNAAAGRRVLSLLPDHHLCVLRREQIVETVSEGFALLDAAWRLGPMTSISGPSATADIEMTRIRGVHGPRRLTVFLT